MRDRLLSIDALRGLAAFTVVLYHTHAVDLHSPTWLKLIAAPATYGFAGVYLFFVLSGFCIHLRTARAVATGESPDLNPTTFWKRRLRRLWPPYVLAMCVYIAVEIHSGALRPGLSLGANLAIHLAMLHNLDTRTAYAFCGVFWTLALEEQLYAAYFLLLRWRWAWGWGSTLAICFGLRCLWLIASRVAVAYSPTFPALEFFLPHWGAWALGAVSVEWALGVTKLPSSTRNPWFAAILLLLGALLYELHQPLVNDHLVYPAWVIGFWIALNTAVAEERRGRSMSVWVRGIAALGVISYSLYLTHSLILDFVAPAFALPRLGLVPVCILLGWGYFQLVERRFLSARQPIIANA